MAKQETYASGTTPVRSDTRRTLLVKILNAYQARAGSIAANNPTVNDTVWTLRKKIDRAIEGI